MLSAVLAGEKQYMAEVMFRAMLTALSSVLLYLHLLTAPLAIFMR